MDRFVLYKMHFVFRKFVCTTAIPVSENNIRFSNVGDYSGDILFWEMCLFALKNVSIPANSFSGK